MQKRITTITQRLVIVLFLSVFIFSSTAVYAISDAQRTIYRSHIKYFDVDACSSNASDAQKPENGTGKPDDAIYPNLDADVMAQSIDKFIKKENPNSELNGLGKTIVASAKNSNINPFLIVAIAHKESGLADPGDFNVSHGHNAFGRTATASQPHFQGARLWYKWSSAKASVDYTAPENNNVSGGGDMATYLRSQYGDTIDNSTLLDLFKKYAPPSENDTTQYVKDVTGWIKEMSGTDANTGGETPGGTSCGTCSTDPDGSAALNGSDNKQKVFNYFVGQGLSPVQAAAIVGNFQQESGNNPSSPGGYLAQWGGGRLTALQTFAQKQGKQVTNLKLQLDYAWLELTGGEGAGQDKSNVLTALKTKTTIADATVTFMGTLSSGGSIDGFENPGNPQLDNRTKFAQQAMDSYGDAAGGDVAGGGCSTSVDCTKPDTQTANLSPIRQNVVCLAKQELADWDNGKMKVGFRKDSADSFSKYSQNADELWCADFVSWLYKQSSYPLDSGSAWRVAFVPNIQAIGQKNDNFHWHPAGGYTPKPGDMALYGGNHVNLVVNVNGDNVKVIGGDQAAGSGGYPDDSRVSQYDLGGSSGGGVTGYVSPD